MTPASDAHRDSPSRPIRTAELLAVGSELTVGETTDTNSGELARSLTGQGVVVTRIAGIPDDLAVVTDAIVVALGRADLVVTTGGLGPTPDDLTREAVAAACGEPTSVDEPTLDWLHDLWARRGQPFPATNVKQAWTIPSATILPNPHGTAPGWWVDRPDGRVVVTLPGPPREMLPMWSDHVLPRLVARGIGAETDVRTLRLTGIGESQVADLLGEPLLRATNPVVATYARVEAVDVRISARTESDADDRTARKARELADEAEAAVLAQLGPHVWARGSTTWAQAIGQALAERGWSLATSERGTQGAVVVMLGGVQGRRLSVVGDDERATAADMPDELGEADRIRSEAGADVGLAVRAEPDDGDVRVQIGIVTPVARVSERRRAFLRGGVGRERVAIATAGVLLEVLRRREAPER